MKFVELTFRLEPKLLKKHGLLFQHPAYKLIEKHSLHNQHIVIY